MSLDALRPFISGVIAAIVAAFLSWIASSFNIQVDQKTEEALQHGIFGVTWVILTKFLAKWINPGDAASKHLIQAQKQVVKEMKETEAINKSAEFDKVNSLRRDD